MNLYFLFWNVSNSGLIFIDCELLFVSLLNWLEIEASFFQRSWNIFQENSPSNTKFAWWISKMARVRVCEGATLHALIIHWTIDNRRTRYDNDWSLIYTRRNSRSFELCIVAPRLPQPIEQLPFNLFDRASQPALNSINRSPQRDA